MTAICTVKKAPEVVRYSLTDYKLLNELTKQKSNKSNQKEATELEFFNEGNDSDEESKQAGRPSVEPTLVEETKPADRVDMIDKMLAELNQDEEVMFEDDDDEVNLVNPVDDEEAIKESKFLEECMSVLNKKKDENEQGKQLDDVNKKR